MNALNNNIFSYIGKNNSRYKDEFEDDILEFEDELANQDKINREFFNVENTKLNIFNDNGFDSLTNIACNNFEKNEAIRTFQLNNKSQIQTIEIIRYCDIINTIYLEIELEENMTFDELTNFDKLKLFETRFELQIGGVDIIRALILTNLFMMFCQDINIKLEGNKFQIPLVDFNITKINNYSNNNIISRDADYGLPSVALQYHELRLTIEFQTKDLFKYMNFNIIVCGRNLDIQPRRALAQLAHEYLFLQSVFEVSDNLDEISLNYNLGAKVIILYFKPLVEDYIDYPKIESIEILMDEKRIFVDQSELLYMELYDMCYTVIPITDDFSSWKNINRTLKNPHKYMTSIVIPYEKKFKLHINYEYKPDNFEICYNVITPNLYRIMSGMGGWGFAN